MDGKKILVVDDERVILNFFRDALQLKGYSVITAESAEEVLAKHYDRETSLMFFDISLPGMSGLELCKQIKQNNPTAIIHAMTGYTTLFEVVDCRDAGFEDYFTKPLDLAAVYEAIENGFKKIARWREQVAKPIVVIKKSSIED